MAITITQQPDNCSAIGQKLIITASSTNVSLDGFKYFIELTILTFNAETLQLDDKVLEFYVSPNPAGALVFDISEFAQTYFPPVSTYFNNSGHGFVDDTNQRFPISVLYKIQSYIHEASIISGVLTVDVGSVVNASVENFMPSKLQIEDAFNPDPELSFGMVNTSSRFLSDRKKDTYKFTLEPLINADANAIVIPVRESDYGVLTTTDKGNIITVFSEVVVTIVDENDNPSTYQFPKTDQSSISNAAIYPANLNGSAMALNIKPQGYPNWKFIKVQAASAQSAPYYFINLDHYGIHQDCRHDVVRIAWVGSRGGWEYFNFYKKNEESVQVERKRYQKAIGTYEAATFSFLPTDAGLKELKPVVQRFITINSDWIQEGEFEYLKGLIVSDTVHMVLDSGTHIPMLVEQNDYTQARERNGKMKNVTLKLRYANDLNV